MYQVRMYVNDVHFAHQSAATRKEAEAAKQALEATMPKPGTTKHVFAVRIFCADKELA